MTNYTKMTTRRSHDSAWPLRRADGRTWAEAKADRDDLPLLFGAENDRRKFGGSRRKFEPPCTKSLKSLGGSSAEVGGSSKFAAFKALKSMAEVWRKLGAEVPSPPKGGERFRTSLPLGSEERRS